MDFKKFYEQREQEAIKEKAYVQFENRLEHLNEIGGGNATEKLIAGTQKLSNKIAAGIKQGIKDVGGAVVQVFGGTSIEQFKNKWKSAIAIAEKVYPYDTKIYAEIKKIQDSKGLIGQFLSISSHKSGTPLAAFAQYSPGIDIVFRAYDTAYKLLQDKIARGKSKERGKDNMSMQSLDEAIQYIGSVRLPKMKTAQDVEEYWKKTALPGTKSSLWTWIDDASYFSYWKNKYNGHDDEGMTDNIVNDIIHSGVSRRVKLDYINDTMLEMENETPPIEVNIQNLEENLKVSEKETVDSILKNADNVARTMGFNGVADITADGKPEISLTQAQTFAKVFSKNMGWLGIIDVEPAVRAFVGLSFVHKSFRVHGNVGDLSSQKNFRSLFNPQIKDNITKLGLKKQGLDNAEETQLRDNFIAYLEGKLENSATKTMYVPTKNDMGDIDKLWDIIKPNTFKEVTKAAPTTQGTP